VTNSSTEIQEPSAEEKLVRMHDEIDAIFNYWKVRFGHARAKLDQKRRSKIRQRLCDGYKSKDLIDAIEGCALSAFHCGQNDRSAVYNDIELICRDAKHVDMFIQLFEKDRVAKARAAALAKQKREEEERLARERAERNRTPRIHGLRSV
jgi:hypothetical protein